MPVLAAALAAGVLLSGGAPIVSAKSPQVGVDQPVLATVDQPPAFGAYWVAAHAATTLWAGPVGSEIPLDWAHQWTILQVVRPQEGDRLFVWDPRSELYAWVDAADVGQVDPDLADSAYLPPIGRHVLWAGSARITKYSCVELGGCARTASGLWPEPGMVAVDPTVIPLGARIWIQGLGTFLAADTGSLVKGAHLDVFSTSYSDAIEWGVQTLPIIVFLD
jgi:3D (Asp-Asp-Asp) domain-containing protein